MSFSQALPYLADLGIGVIGGFVGAGVTWVYQWWVDKRAEWPFETDHVASPDLVTGTRPEVKIVIRNRTTRTVDLDLSFQLPDGSLAVPARVYLTSDPGKDYHLTTLPVGPKETKEFVMVSGGAYSADPQASVPTSVHLRAVSPGVKDRVRSIAIPEAARSPAFKPTEVKRPPR